MKDELQQTWRALASDNLSGASEIHSRVLAALAQHFSLLFQTTKALQDWPQLLREMLHAQPAMAPLYTLANQLALIFEQEHLREQDRLALALSFIQTETLRASRSNEAIAAQAFSLIAAEPRVLTHSASGTVAAALEYARRKGVNVEAYISEARPANEGRRMAERLARAGISVHFFVDDARAHFLNEVDAVLLGADRISENAFVNKIGSRSVAQLALAQKIPVAVLAGRNKLWPANLPFGQELEHAREEVWAGAPPNITLHDFYFEEIELHNAACVITDEGIFTPNHIQNELHGFHAAEFWRPS